MEITDIEQAKATLRKARLILDKDGWTHGKWKCEDGKYCVDGAVAAAAGLAVTVDNAPGFEDAAQGALWRYLDAATLLARHVSVNGDWNSWLDTYADRKPYEVLSHWLYHYNDRTGRTIDEVNTALNAAIHSEESK